MHFLDKDRVYRRIIEQARDYAIYMLDAEGHVRSWNLGAEELYGYPGEAVIGRPVADLYPPERRAGALPVAALEQARRDGRYRGREHWQGASGAFWAETVIDRVVAGQDPAARFVVFVDTGGMPAETPDSRRFRLFFESVAEYAIAMLDPDGRIVTCNPATGVITGHAVPDLAGRHVSLFYSEADRRAGRPEQMLATARQHGRHQFEGWRPRADGSTFWASVILIPIHEHGEMVGFAEVTRNSGQRHRRQRELIEARRSAEKRYRESRSLSNFLHEVINNIPIRVLVQDGQTDVLLMDNCQPAARGDRLAGIDAQIMLVRLSADAESVRGTGEPVQRELALEVAGTTVRLKCRIIRVQKEPGTAGNLMYLIEDMTEEYAANEKIDFMAHHDGLTHLPNRSLLGKRLQQALDDARYAAFEVGVLLIDLDSFKDINDVLGHPVGDHLLVEMGARLGSVLRSETILARVGGDEFCAVLPRCAGRADVEVAATQLIDAAQAPIPIDGRNVQTGISIGMVLSSDDRDNAQELLRCADLALYEAKRQGRGRASMYHRGLHEAAHARLDMEIALRRAFEADEFVLHYQPIMAADSLTVASMEALLRWQHPERGTIPPLEFIPLAEETGLIKELGARVLGQACLAASTWGSNVGVAVNLSPVQFHDDALVVQVRRALAESGLAPARLELEITESILLDTSRRNIRILEQLKALGVQIVLDDFGTGYSSLHYLRSFPFDRIKIDKSFVRGVCHDGEAQAIVKAITSLGRSLNIQITAEGVENVDQANLLRSDGCSHLQGFYFGRPNRRVDQRVLCEAPAEVAAPAWQASSRPAS